MHGESTAETQRDDLDKVVTDMAVSNTTMNTKIST